VSAVVTVVVDPEANVRVHAVEVILVSVAKLVEPEML
jgi:hypothetical protein